MHLQIADNVSLSKLMLRSLQQDQLMSERETFASILCEPEMCH